MWDRVCTSRRSIEVKREIHSQLCHDEGPSKGILGVFVQCSGEGFCLKWTIIVKGWHLRTVNKIWETILSRNDKVKSTECLLVTYNVPTHALTFLFTYLPSTLLAYPSVWFIYWLKTTCKRGIGEGTGWSSFLLMFVIRCRPLSSGFFFFLKLLT